MNTFMNIVLSLAGMAGMASAQAPMAQLRVSTIPDGAMVSCDGVLYDASPITIPNLAPGEHLILVEKPGFNDTRRTVTLSSASRKVAIELKLDPTMGLVLVQTSSPGVDIKIDGADRGKTPILLTDLPVGRHSMTLTAPGFTPKNVDLMVENRTPQLVSLDLSSDSAKLVFQSSPPGASVTVNGLSKGTTPCEVDQLPTGENTVLLSLAGYVPFQQKVKLQAGTSQRIDATLSPFPITLSVISSPPGARVFIDDKLVGQTPLTLDTIAPGSCAIRAEMTGFEPETRSIELKAQERRVEEFMLARLVGTAEILTDQPGTRVTINGEEKGYIQAARGKVAEPVRVELPVGEHKLVLSKRGYRTLEKTLVIRKGEIEVVREQMPRHFVPDTLVRLKSSDMVTGCMGRKLPNGDIEFETKLGIYRTLKADEIVSVEPIIEEKR